MFHDARLKRLAGVLKIASSAAMVLLPLSLLVPLWGDGLTRADAMKAFPGLHIWPGVETWQLVVAMGLGCLAAIAGIWVLWQMRGLFRLYQMGEVLTDAAARHIRKIGQGLLAVAILPVVVFPLQTVILTMNNPEGERSVAVGFELNDVAFLLAGGMLVLIGWAMGEASRMAQDHAAIV